ncbi:MAG: TetR/AcrR family transcriptional regulator [Pseudomonadota bacterium]
MSDVTEPGPTKKKPQARSERTRKAILEAAETLLVRNGTEAVSMTAIAKKAGVAVGTVYIHFQDKNALIRAFLEHMVEDFRATIARAADGSIWEGKSVLAIVEGYIHFMQVTGKEQMSQQIAVSHLLAEHPDMGTKILELRSNGRRAVGDLILSRRDQIGHSNPDQAVPFLIDQLDAMMQLRLDPVHQVHALSDASDAAFRNEALKISKIYLQLESQPTDPDYSGGFSVRD